MKKIIFVFITLIALLMFGLFAYFYYIKPQREFIEINAQKCITEAMTQINSEVIKHSPNPYVTRQGFDNMLGVQRTKLNKCTDSYNSIFLSRPEKKLFLLNLNSELDSQERKINEYIKRIDDKISENEQQQNKKKACADMEAEQKKYQDCVVIERGKGNTYYSSAEYISFFTDFLGNSKGDVNKDICLSEYNYQRFGVSMIDCSFLSF
jgi:hypothetical protein